MTKQLTQLELLLYNYEQALLARDHAMTEYWAQQIDQYSIQEEQFARFVDQMYDDIWRD